jgi:hypothetical protein
MEGAMRTALVFAVLILAASATGSAGPGDGLLGALSKAKVRVIRAAIGQPENNRSVTLKSPPTYARFDVETTGKPMSPADAASLARSMVETVEAMGGTPCTHVEVDFYAKGRFADRGASGLNRLGHKTASNNPSGAVWIPDPNDVDVTKPVQWYLRICWWRPITIRAQEIVDMDRWEATYWLATGNAVAAGEDGSSAAHTPELVK